jgi:hypothetical protein
MRVSWPLGRPRDVAALLSSQGETGKRRTLLATEISGGAGQNQALRFTWPRRTRCSVTVTPASGQIRPGQPLPTR